MSKEAMKLALENSQPSFLTPGWTLVRNEDITALREALAKPDFWEGYVPEPVKPAQRPIKTFHGGKPWFVQESAQQEPVTWGVDWGKAGDIPCVSIIKRLPGGGIEVVAVEYGPERTWVGLTDEEQTQVAWSCGAMSVDWLDFARAIEAKLRSKNEDRN